MGFGLTVGAFTSLAGFEDIHFRLTQKLKKFRRMASSLTHVSCRNRTFCPKQIDGFNFYIIQPGDTRRFGDSKKIIERPSVIPFGAVADIFFRGFKCLNSIFDRFWFPIVWPFHRGKFPVRFVETSGIERPTKALPFQGSIHSQAALAVEELRSLLTMGTFAGMETNQNRDRAKTLTLDPCCPRRQFCVGIRVRQLRLEFST